MSAADYSSFASRVVLFETLQLSPETQVRADQLKQYETSDYAKQNPAYVDPKAATNVVVTLKDAASSKFTCFDDDGITAYVALTPQVQTEQKDSDGTTTTKNPFFPYPVQTSIWTLQGDQWFLSGLT
jgi:hypothetical protein